MQQLEKPQSTGLLGRLSTEKLIFIGASTGGTEAIKEVLVHLPADMPAIVITQHMPATFTTILAEHLGQAAGMQSAEAKDGEGQSAVCGAPSDPMK